MSNTTDPTALTGVGSAASTVQWQSAFWSIAAVALNTIVQPAGQVVRLPSKYAIALRSSPFFCLVDTFNILHDVIKCAKYMSLRQAISYVAEHRHQRDDQDDKPSFSQILISWLLLAAAIVQAVKLFACRGLPWTQAFGATYLASYLVVEVLNELGRPSEANPPPEPPDEVDIHARGIREDSTVRAERVGITVEATQRSLEATSISIIFSANLQTFAWVSLLSGLFPQIVLEPYFIAGANVPTWYPWIIVPCAFIPSLLQFAGIMMTLIVPFLLIVLAIELSILFGPSLSMLYLIYLALKKWCHRYLVTVSEVFDVQETTLCLTIGAAATSTMVYGQFHLIGMGWIFKWSLEVGLLPWVMGFAERYSPPAAFPTASQWAAAGLVLAATHRVFTIMYKVLFVGRLASSFGLAKYHDGTDRPRQCTFLLITNIVTAMLYFGLVYSDKGTYKPGWTNNLG